MIFTYYKNSMYGDVIVARPITHNKFCIFILDFSYSSAMPVQFWNDWENIIV